MTVRYAHDGLCHNAQRGTYGHECGKPATWIGTSSTGFESGFCDRCREHGDEARDKVAWRVHPRVEMYGRNLPVFPALYDWPSPITEERVERAAERLMDRADAALLAGEATQAQYEAWVTALDAWTRDQRAAS